MAEAMHRTGFSWGTAAGVVALIFLVLPGPSASAATTVVHPTGTFPADVQNVQAALDQGGTVLLKAVDAGGTPKAFNFGAPLTGQGVSFNRDAALIGERVGAHQTTIRGGRSTIRVIGPPVEVRIEGLRFDGPGIQAMVIFSAGKAEIVGNHIANVVGIPIANNKNVTRAFGINEGSTRELLIEGNVIDGVDATLGLGIVQCCTTGTAAIRNNHVSRVNTFGIESAINEGPVAIEHNFVVPDPNKDPSDFDQGGGISLLSGGPYLVSDNTVITGRPGARGIQGVDFTTQLSGAVITRNLVVTDDGEAAIALGGVDSVVTRNLVVTDHVKAAILLGGEVSDAQVERNYLAGNGIVALAALDETGEGTDSLIGTTFEANDIADFKSDEADVFLDVTTRDSLVTGNGGTVVDLGTNNTIDGFTVIPDRHVGDKLRK